MKEFVTRQGQPALQAIDGGQEWYQPTVNPFGHGCCDCGLFHQVEFCLADEQGEEIPLPAGSMLALRFTRDEQETRRLREHKAKGDGATLRQLADLLVRYGVIEAEAISDPEGYDNARTVVALRHVAARLREAQQAG